MEPFGGDECYCFDCTGDVVVGDEVRFSRALFTGSWRNAKFAGLELVTGTVIRDSYGKQKQQHTFTIELPDGNTLAIKGRNLYRNGCWRKPWDDEAAREKARTEKHFRGACARQARNERVNGYV
jgi:hypothetical protein